MQLSEGVFQDRELSKSNEIVWYHDEKVLRSLQYEDGTWYLVGYLSTAVAGNLPSFHFQGIEYIKPPDISYALFDEETDILQWERAYYEFTTCSPQCSLQEFCKVVSLSQFCKCRCIIL